MTTTRGENERGPVLAVLPFAAPGGSEADALIAQGLHEDVCGELSRFRAFAVISPISAAAVADRSDAEIGTVLGATHVLRGRLRRAGEMLEVSASLVDCAGATQLWTERLTAPGEEFFSLREGIVARIVATLAARLEETVLAEARRRPTESLAAYALTLRGLAKLREATLAADAILVANWNEPALAGVESQLDVCARVDRVAFGARSAITLLSPLPGTGPEWTLAHGFDVARASRARVASVGGDAPWREALAAGVRLAICTTSDPASR